MAYAFLYGLGTGMVFSLMLGTVFFSLIQNSIDYGYRSGVFIALGVIVADIIFILAAIFGAQYLPEIDNFDFYVNLLGFCLLIVLGLVSIMKKNPQLVYPKTQWGSNLYFLGNGFLLNTLNPANFFIWVAIVAKLTEDNFLINEVIIFFIACLLAIFGTEVGIAIFASRLKKFFTPKTLQYVNRIAGIIFMLFGIKLLLDAFQLI
ncbi:MAG: LysE family transporter [Bacteroidota bacterium]